MGDARDVIRCEDHGTNPNDPVTRYRFDWEKRKWFKEGTQPPEYIEGNPPCVPPNFDPNQPRPRDVSQPSRAGLGLVPDQNGEVSPMITIQDFSPQREGEYQLDDYIDLLFVAEATWVLPFETDSELLASIGEGNIHYFNQVFQDDGNPAPKLVHLDHIRLGDAITVLEQLGINSINVKIDGDTFCAKLAGDAVNGYLVLIYMNDKLLGKIAIN